MPRADVDVERARNLVHAAVADPDGWLDAGAAYALLGACAIPSVRTRQVSTPEEAAEAQAALGGTVVVKAAAAIHKRDVGGVRTGVTTGGGAAEAARAIRAALADAGLADAAHRLLVQEQVGSGLEMIVGVNRDPLVGPLVLVGLGGTAAELLGDVAVRVAPLTDVDSDEMLASLRSAPLLTGYRGAPALDIAALRDVLHRVSTLAVELPEIAEIDLNPVFVLEDGVAVADVRVRAAGRRAETPVGAPGGREPV